MTRYRVYTSISVTVYVEDGKVTGVDAEDGWAEPSIEGEEDDGLSFNVSSPPPIFTQEQWKASEEGQVLNAMSGRWKVEALP